MEATHNFKEFVMNYTNGQTATYICCCKCGTPFIVNPTAEQSYCNEKIANSVVFNCKMSLKK